MKLVLVGPVYPYRGGIAHYTTMLARALGGRHETRVISFKRQYPAWLYPGRTDKDPSREPLRAEAEYLLDPVNPLTWQATARRILGLAPNLLVLQWWNTFWAPATAWLAGACRRADVPVLFLVHNVLPHEPRPWDRPLARWALGRGARFIVHTEAERERLLSLLPRAQAQVCPMPLFDLFTPSRISQAEARAHLGLLADKQILLFFGIVRPYKGLRYLIEATAILRAEGQDVYLAVAGEFWGNKSEYVAQIERLGLAEHVRLDDRYIPNEEVGLYFAAADMLVAPYVSGTQSAAVKAAMAVGLPAVVTERSGPGNGETIQHKVMSAKAGDSGSISKAVKALAKLSATNSAPSAGEGYGWNQIMAVVEAIGARQGY